VVDVPNIAAVVEYGQANEVVIVASLDTLRVDGLPAKNEFTAADGDEGPVVEEEPGVFDNALFAASS
jgi:hypothetical protein